MTGVLRAHEIPVAELRAGLSGSFWLSAEVQTVLKLIDEHTLDEIILAVCLVGPDLLAASDSDAIDLTSPVEHPLELPVETWISLLQIPFLRAIIAARYPLGGDALPTLAKLPV